MLVLSAFYARCKINVHVPWFSSRNACPLIFLCRETYYLFLPERAFFHTKSSSFFMSISTFSVTPQPHCPLHGTGTLMPSGAFFLVFFAMHFHTAPYVSVKFRVRHLRLMASFAMAAFYHFRSSNNRRTFLRFCTKFSTFCTSFASSKVIHLVPNRAFVR